MAVAAQRRGRFFLIMGLILVALVLAGFVPAALTRPGGVTSMPLLLHVHGAVFLGWFLLFTTQAALVQSNNVAMHRRLGAASIALAAAMLALGYLVIRHAHASPAFSIAGLTPSGSTIFPMTDMVNFSIVYGLALLHRGNVGAHKRLMLLAGILIIDPAVARLVLTAGLPLPMIALLELALLGALVGYDIVTRRRPHWASLLGLTVYVIALVAKLTIAKQAWWSAFAKTLFG